ncbi:MAG: hypothetical protein KPI85_06195 [cyanobacterium endosymbiont of Epithemia adnata isolate EadnSB Bon19]|jgi:hypothetical protein
MGNENNNHCTEIDNYTIDHFTHLKQQWKIKTQWGLAPDFSLSKFHPTDINTYTQQVKAN